MHVAISQRLLIESWRLLTMRAIALFALALAALSWPVLPLASLVFTVSSIALVSGLLDAALFGALHRGAAGKWALLAESFIGVTLGGTLLVYPIVPLGLVGGFVCAWIAGRGAMLVTAGRGDHIVRRLSLAWGLTSLAAAAWLIATWDSATIERLCYLLAVYALLWGILEFVVARRLRAYAHVFAPRA